MDDLISIHALLAESDGCFRCFAADSTYFYPRSPCGERRRVVFFFDVSLFLSTLSLRRATNTSIAGRITSNDFYPRSPCGERRWLRCWQLAARDISIHALLAESDEVAKRTTDIRPISIHALLAESDDKSKKSKTKKQISIHALLAESDGTESMPNRPEEQFLSTLSLRRATCRAETSESRYRHFYPRSPCGERPAAGRLLLS